MFYANLYHMLKKSVHANEIDSDTLVACRFHIEKYARPYIFNDILRRVVETDNFDSVSTLVSVNELMDKNESFIVCAGHFNNEQELIPLTVIAEEANKCMTALAAHAKQIAPDAA